MAIPHAPFWRPVLRLLFLALIWIAINLGGNLTHSTGRARSPQNTMQITLLRIAKKWNGSLAESTILSMLMANKMGKELFTTCGALLYKADGYCWMGIFG